MTSKSKADEIASKLKELNALMKSVDATPQHLSELENMAVQLYTRAQVYAEKKEQKRLRQEEKQKAQELAASVEAQAVDRYTKMRRIMLVKQQKAIGFDRIPEVYRRQVLLFLRDYPPKIGDMMARNYLKFVGVETETVAIKDSLDARGTL